jgi:hypothetical protein
MLDRPVWTAYQQIKDQLVGGGIQAGQVKFIDDFLQAEQKARLFEQCRNGEVAVLLGSTAMTPEGHNFRYATVGSYDS